MLSEKTCQRCASRPSTDDEVICLDFSTGFTAVNSIRGSVLCHASSWYFQTVGAEQYQLESCTIPKVGCQDVAKEVIFFTDDRIPRLNPLPSHLDDGRITTTVGVLRLCKTTPRVGTIYRHGECGGGGKYQNDQLGFRPSGGG